MDDRRPVVAVVHDRGERLATSPGIRARVDSLVSWIEAGGAEARVLSTEASGSRVRRLLSTIRPMGRVVSDDVDLVVVVALNSPHLVLLALRSARRHHVVVDVCDSVIDTVRIAMSAGRPLQAVKSLLQVGAVTVASRLLRLLYVAEKDRRHDGIVTGRRRPAIVSQSMDASLLDLDDYVGPPDRVVIAADYRAYHNLAGMRMLLEVIAARPAVLSVPIELYGPQAPDFDLPRGVVYRGWAGEKRDVYAGQTAVFVPNTGAAGLQNKLLEALQARRPVLAGRAVVDGLVDDLAVSAYESTSDLGVQLRRLQQRVVPPGTRWPAPTTASTPLSEVLAGRRRP